MIWLANLEPIGSVVSIDDRRFVVIGHRMTREGEGVGAGYVLVPYPLGFVDANSLFEVPASRVGEVVAKGLSNDDGVAHVAQLEELAQAMGDITYAEYASGVQLLHDFAQEGGANA